ncbi:MAG: hypothetical protein P8184_13095 [Calditrichia bacterium]
MVVLSKMRLKSYLFAGIFIFSFAPGITQTNSRERQAEELYSLSEKTERLIDYYLQQKWKIASSLVDSLAGKEAELDDSMRKLHLPFSMGDELDYLLYRLRVLNLEKNDPIGAAYTANQMTDLMVDLERQLKQSVPLGIYRMDYLGRELIILLHLPHSDQLLQHRILDLSLTWKRLKKVILKEEIESRALELLQMEEKLENLFN